MRYYLWVVRPAGETFVIFLMLKSIIMVKNRKEDNGEEKLNIIILIIAILVLVSLLYDFATNPVCWYDWFPGRWRFDR